MGEWLFIGGEGRNGSVEFLTPGFGDLKAAYNPSHVLYSDRTNLLQNYPNPFNLSTIVVYELPSVARATVKVYDVLAREVALLSDGVQDPGVHTVTWNAVGRASGVYITVLLVAGRSEARKMLFLK